MATKRTCCSGRECSKSEVQEIVLTCTGAKCHPVLGAACCRFNDGTEVKCQRDVETNALSCAPPQSWDFPRFNFELYSLDGKLISKNVAADCSPSFRCSGSRGVASNVCNQIDGVASPDAMKDPATEVIGGAAVLRKLSILDRLLPFLVIGAMILGVVLGYYTDISASLDVAQVDTVSLPIAVGLWMMMWPVLCKVKYELLGTILRDRTIWKQLATSLVLNWLVGPLLMTGLAWATLPDLPGYRNGIILVGIARCIAMVLIWNQLACGNAEYCAILVAVNSIMQIVLFAPLSLFYLQVVSRQYQGPGAQLHLDFWQVCRSVLIFLGIPLVAGVLTRYGIIAAAGRDWFNNKFLPRFGPLALVALIYTIIIIFALQGRQVIDQIGSVCRVAVPMVLYFSIMWFATLFDCKRRGFKYEHAVTQAFTASSNNFELAIAVSVGTFGILSQEALAATVGPLIEVPVLLGLVYVALALRKVLRWA